MVESLQRLGFDVTERCQPIVSGATAPATDVDLAIIEFDQTAPTDARFMAEVSALQSAGVPLIVRHHDVEKSSDVFSKLPSTSLVHAAINLRSRRELIALGFCDVALLPHTFDVKTELAATSTRQSVRDDLGIEADAILLLQPTRISERKNLAGSVRYLQLLARILPPERLHFWATGPVDPDFQDLFDKLVPHIPTQSTIRGATNIGHAYEACDAVLYPTTGERFGAVIFESIRARRPCIAGSYPALGEFQAQGIQLFTLDDPAELVKFLAKPTPRLHDVNQRRAALAFGPDVFDAALRATIGQLKAIA